MPITTVYVLQIVSYALLIGYPFLFNNQLNMKAIYDCENMETMDCNDYLNDGFLRDCKTFSFVLCNLNETFLNKSLNHLPDNLYLTLFNSKEIQHFQTYTSHDLLNYSMYNITFLNLIFYGIMLYSIVISVFKLFVNMYRIKECINTTYITFIIELMFLVVILSFRFIENMNYSLEYYAPLYITLSISLSLLSLIVNIGMYTKYHQKKYERIN